MTPSGPKDQKKTGRKPSKKSAANEGSRRALVDGTKDPQDHFGLNFRVSKMTKYDSDPPIYHLEIDGSKSLRLKADTLMSMHKFRIRFMEVMHKIPNLPQEKDDWFAIVNHWSSLAEVKQPEEASLVGSIRTELRDLLRSLAIGDIPEDLDHGRILPHPKYGDTFLVRQSTLHTLLRDKLGAPVDADTMAEQLRQLNADYGRVRLGRLRLRLWIFTLALDDPGGESPADTDDTADASQLPAPWTVVEYAAAQPEPCGESSTVLVARVEHPDGHSAEAYLTEAYDGDGYRIWFDVRGADAEVVRWLMHRADVAAASEAPVDALNRLRVSESLPDAENIQARADRIEREFRCLETMPDEAFRNVALKAMHALWGAVARPEELPEEFHPAAVVDKLRRGNICKDGPW